MNQPQNCPVTMLYGKHVEEGARYGYREGCAQDCMHGKAKGIDAFEVRVGVLRCGKRALTPGMSHRDQNHSFMN